MTRRGRIVRLLMVLVAVCVAAWVGRRWTTAAALSVALLALSAAWIAGTLVAMALDFYWPPKVSRYHLPGDDREMRRLR